LRRVKSWVSGTLLDIRIAIRTMAKRPGFVAIIVLTLALGVGANTTIFSAVNACLLRPLPFPDSDRLMAVFDRQPPDDLTPASFPEFQDWRGDHAVFGSVVGQFTLNMNVTGRHEPARIRVATVSQDFFPVFGIQPLLGRTFAADEHRSGARHVVVIGYQLWQREFGGDTGAAGQSITLNGAPYTVVGVVSGERLRFGSPQTTDAWIPLEPEPPWKERGQHFLTVIGKRKPGVSMEQAQSGLKVLSAQLDAKYHTGHGIVASPLKDAVFGDARPSLLILFGAAGLLLLIACANVANLLLARASARGKEFAIRVALGAGRWRLLRQTLTESLLLSSLGAVGGFLLALWGMSLVQQTWPTSLPRPDKFGIDWRVFIFLLAVSAASGILFGLAPVLQISTASLAGFLKDGWGAASGAGSHNRIRRALVAAEVAVASVLSIGAGLLIQSLWRVMQVDAGFHPENVLSMSLSLPASRYKEDRQLIAFYDDLMERLHSLPATVAAGAIVNLPLGGGGMNGDFRVDGRTFPQNQEPIAEKYIVTPDYFRAMGVSLLRGRLFSERDGRNGHNVIIVSQSVARKFWPDEDPIGKRIDMGLGDMKGWQEVVGVVPDVKREGLDQAAGMELYVPYSQVPVTAMTLVIRSTMEVGGLAAAARAQVLAIDKDQPVYAVRTMREVVSDSLSGRRASTGLLGTFAGLALLLASIGIYGVVSNWVAQRTREIGIRSALGANPRDIAALVLGRAMLTVSIGMAVGLIASLALTRFLSSQLFEVKPHDAWTMTSVPVVLGLVAIVACYFPTRRATRVDPITALRFE
jgi:putative ABC transport system permease protein